MNTININLPKNADKKILIALSIPFGYFNESDKDFGLAHLAEHYIVKAIEKEFKIKDLSGEISDENLYFYITLKKDAYSKFIQSDIDNILLKISENIDSVLLNNEKKRIEIELEEKYSDSFKKLSQTIESTFISSPKFINRDRLEQIKNIRSFKPSDISQFIFKMSKIKKNIFVRYVGNKNDYQKSKVYINRLSYKVEYKVGKEELKISHPIFKKTSNSAICFKGFNSSVKYSDRISLSILAKEVYKRFNKKVSDFGVYSADFKNLISQKYGIVWYSTNSYAKNKFSIAEIFYKTVDEVISDKEFFKKLPKIKKERIEKDKENWNLFYARFDWIFNDMSDSGKNVELTEVIKSINEVDEKRIKKVAKIVFNSKNSLVLESKK